MPDGQQFGDTTLQGDDKFLHRRKHHALLYHSARDFTLITDVLWPSCSFSIQPEALKNDVGQLHRSSGGLSIDTNHAVRSNVKE